MKINKGATFKQKFVWQNTKKRPIDLTGFTARMQARLDITSDSVLLNLTTENSGIVLGGKAGSVMLYISAQDTSMITWAKAVYDIELVSPSNEVYRLTSGNIVVTPEVTR